MPLQLTAEFMAIKIAPLILFSFIENAFQHGVNPEEESIIEIKIKVFDEYLKLHVFNKKVKTQYRGGTGIGLKNTIKRLKLIYPDKYDLQIVESKTDFKIELTILLNK